jgi:DnaJ-class molecular chaperone
MVRMVEWDYYEILGVSRTATADHIRTAYRKLARKYHPDVNKAANAADKFKEATAAYEVLSDAEKRKMYDQFGRAGSRMGPGAAGQGPFGGGGRPGAGGSRTYTWSPGQGAPPGGMDFEEMFGSSPFAGMSLEELMAALGGGGRATGRRRGGPTPGPAPRGSDLEHPVTLDFLQAVHGTTMTLQMRREDGTAERINVRIPPGVHDGSKIRVRGKGNVGPGGTGDLYIVVSVRPSDQFRREGSDITTDLPISITEAAFGGTASVVTIDGPTTVKIPPGASSGTKLRLRGKGVADPRTGQRGDHYALVKIVVHKTISQRGRQLLEEFARTDPYNPRAGD